MKNKLFVLVGLFALLVVGFQNCTQPFEPSSFQETIGSSHSGQDQDQNQDQDNEQNQPPKNPIPPGPSAPVVLAEYLPNIPPEHCQPEMAITDPFAGLTFNRKTVCASGCDYTGVEDAIKKASAFDEIVVEAGHYQGCLKITASPVIVRGENGLVALDSTACSGNTIQIASKQIKLSNFKVSGGTGSGIGFDATVDFALLEGLWLEGLASAIGGTASNNAQVIIRNFKIKDVGYVWGSNNHTTSNISVTAPVLIVSRGVFSHFRLDSFPFGTWAKHTEFLCNVVAKVNGEKATNYFHFTRPHYIRIAKNFMHHPATPRVSYVYQYLLDPGGTKIFFEDNYLINDNSGNYIFNVDPGSQLSVTNNTIVGGMNTYFHSPTSVLDLVSNHYYPSRAAAGIPEAPGFPSTWPVTKW